jgi:hypothetical protein
MKSKFSKKLISLILAFIIFLLTLSSCSSQNESDEGALSVVPKELYSYNKESYPVMIRETDNGYFAFFGELMGAERSLYFGESYESMEECYSTEGGEVWSFSAGDYIATWCEITEDRRLYSYYDAQKGEGRVFHTATADMGYQCSSVGVYEKSLYYSLIDYDASRASVMRYNTENKKHTELYTFDYTGDTSIMNLSVRDNLLIVSGYISGTVSVVISDLSGKAKDICIPLSEDVLYVYDSDYDEKSATASIYYRSTSQEEHIATVRATANSSLTTVYTFEENCYASYDEIEIYGGRIVFILRRDREGSPADNHSLIVYSISEKELLHLDKAFSAYSINEGIFALKFNTGDAKNTVSFVKAELIKE